MKKKFIAGALVVGAVATLGLTGCDDGKNPEEPKTYTVTFDSNPNTTTDDETRTYKEGETSLADIPAVPQGIDGFAGVWESFTLNNSDITVTAKYGNGTATSPYLVASASQFKIILAQYASTFTTKYFNALGQEVSAANDAEALANSEITSRVDGYATGNITYTKSGSEWSASQYTQTNNIHFKLIDDIYLSEVQTATGIGGTFFCGTIDGDNHNIYSFSNETFANTDGAMFMEVAGATVKNLKIHMGENIATIFGFVESGDNCLENITVENASGIVTQITPADNNESAFAWHLVKGTLTMTNLTNNADYISLARNTGIFLGGYACDGTTISFTNCVNNGDITASGVVGLFFGNNFRTAGVNNITITNCANNGTIKAASGSSIMGAIFADPTNLTEDLSTYVGADNVDDYNAITTLNSDYTATISGSTITVTNNDTELENEKYQLVLQAYAGLEGGGSILTSIVVDATVEADNKSVVFENKLYGMIDLNSYMSQYSITENDLPTTGWITMSGYTDIRYFLDTERGCYVFDFSAHEEKLGLAINYTFNVSASNLMKTIAVIDETDNIVDFVVNFSTAG